MLPNSELGRILVGDECGCDGTAFDVYYPCLWSYHEVGLLNATVFCDTENYDHKRIMFIPKTINEDALVMKQTLWSRLQNFYGFERAAIIMPSSFNIEHDRTPFLGYCLDNPNATFVLKNHNLHGQTGIKIATGQQITDGFDLVNISLAQLFLPPPFLISGHGVNVRQSLLVICVSGRVRGYIAQDAKAYYTSVPYKAPWHHPKWGHADAATEVLASTITTGYLSSKFFEDKPMSFVEFLAHLRGLGHDPSKFQGSMHARLALALHANGEICGANNNPLLQFPTCLNKTILFQHFGCDFSVDPALNGHQSRLFECNKGPDMIGMNLRDVAWKRNVAADIISFVGFTGPFDDSPARAHKFGFTKVYDSLSFDAQAAFETLSSLNSASSTAYQPSEPMLEAAHANQILENQVHNEL